MKGYHKKRQRKDHDDDEDMIDEDDEIKIDEVQTAKKTENDDDITMGDMVYVEFVFSGLKESNFHNLKTLVKPMFEFENVSISGIVDVILQLKEFVGTSIKTEDDEQTNKTDVDIFGIFSMIPMTFFKENESIKQVNAYLKGKIEKYCKPAEKKVQALEILSSSSLGFLINERAINLPQETIAPALKFIINEINESTECEDYDGRFQMEYVVICTKFVKRQGNKAQGKKSRVNNEDNGILYYKHETPHFIEKATISFDYKIPYKEMNMEYLENSNEPQYMNILFIKTEDFLSVIESVISKDSK